MEVGDKLNPQRYFRKGFVLKGITTTYHKNEHSPPNLHELLTVRFPDLKENQVVIPRN